MMKIPYLAIKSGLVTRPFNVAKLRPGIESRHAQSCALMRDDKPVGIQRFSSVPNVNHAGLVFVEHEV